MAPPGPRGSASGAVETGTVARVAAVAALALAVVIVAVVVLGGERRQDVHIDFQNAGQLVKGDDVQVGGRRIGSGQGISLTNNNHRPIKVTIEDPYVPLHEGTTAIVRATSLSGIANRYIALTPGPNSNRSTAGGPGSVRTARRRSSTSTSSSTRSTRRRARGCRTSSRARRRSTRARAQQATRPRSTSARRCRRPRG